MGGAGAALGIDKGAEGQDGREEDVAQHDDTCSCRPFAEKVVYVVVVMGDEGGKRLCFIYGVSYDAIPGLPGS